MTIEDVIEYMSEMKSVVSSKTLETVKEIYALASAYSYMKAKFTFDVNGDLDKEVTQLLLELSDEILSESRARALKTIEDDDDTDAVLAYIDRDIYGASATERVDSHSSHLKVLLEAYFAVCFARGLSSSDILGSTLRFLANPLGFSGMLYAFQHSEDYASEYIISYGFHFGRGKTTNPIDGFILVASTMINEAFQYFTMMKYRRDKDIIGYRVHRGSTYDCMVCDELCVGVHPLTEICLPAHPRCCCWTTPVYKDD